MAQFDMSKAVRNLLSGGGETAQERVTDVIKNSTDMTRLPAVDVGKLANLPGVGDALGGVGGALGIGGSRRQESKPKSKKVKKTEFSSFSMNATHSAVAMASKLMEIADRKGGDDGLADALGTLGALDELVGEVTGLPGNLTGDFTEKVSEIVGDVGTDAMALMGLRQQALRLFITHYPPAREKFKLEPLEQRQPNLVRRTSSRATPPEDRLSFWREDTQLNEHHGHWHEVNPVSGRPVPGGVPDFGDRHGELFVYMHLQMLARYDAERLGVGLPRVKPFDDYRAPIPEGYDPGDLMVWDGNQWVGFSARPENATIKDFAPQAPEWSFGLPGAKIDDMEKARDALFEAARRGSYEVGNEQISITNDNFGNTVEANNLSVDVPSRDNPEDPANFTNYGNIHNIGHVHFAYFGNTNGPAGVMGNLDATVRDPVFWRWHKHVDTIVQAWRETLGKRESHDFAEGLPVTVRSEDIILCGEGGIPTDVDGEMIGTEAFGYSEDTTGENSWNNDFSSGTVTLSNGTRVTTTNELTTEMRTRTIQVYDSDSGQTVPEEIDYLSHEDFFYFIRLQNHSEQAQQVTIRIFLAPEPWVDDNTAWIEMDRFLHRLAGHEHAVVFRPARLSAVIRKSALGHAELESPEPRPPATTWCDCGWPYTLLLPRSTKEGADFRLLVVLSSDDLTMTDTGQECTSMSYCGLQDSEYPDKRLMGYPFDRPLNDSIDSIIEKHESWASRTIQIRCKDL
ncbi:MAG: tyrosinase family protein [Pseudonocardia sp.]